MMQWNNSYHRPDVLKPEKPTRPVKPAREYALSVLERADRTEYQLRSKMTEKEYPAEEIDAVIIFLKEYRYIDDAEYARRYIRAYSSRKSVRQIKNSLVQRGISREIIEASFEENTVDEELQIRILLIKKGYCPGERMEADAYRKMTASLARRGYSYSAIQRTMDRMCEEEI